MGREQKPKGVFTPLKHTISFKLPMIFYHKMAKIKK